MSTTDLISTAFLGALEGDELCLSMLVKFVKPHQTNLKPLLPIFVSILNSEPWCRDQSCFQVVWGQVVDALEWSDADMFEMLFWTKALKRQLRPFDFDRE